ncbi:hypothetical protein D2E27_20300 [Mycobacteroides abscessus]|nr:hypothetical protein D2E27_20300 [Mycobacteroides abscessus]RIS03544.1 hypothetical protein D2E58_09505 [Mycobacteroides abscessus]
MDEDVSMKLDPLLCPPEPMLLDTCVIRNLVWVWNRERTNIDWTDDEDRDFKARFGPVLSTEILALWELVDRFEYQSRHLPWIVSMNSRRELENCSGGEQKQLIEEWERFRDCADEWGQETFGSVAPGLLYSIAESPSPILLRGLRVKSYDDVCVDGGPLGFLPDAGDRMLVREAIFAGVSAILTTDVGMASRHKSELKEFGIEIWRPTELLHAYHEYWK